jgi:hypothetical protein
MTQTLPFLLFFFQDEIDRLNDLLALVRLAMNDDLMERGAY